jgi:hypothetical protein
METKTEKIEGDPQFVNLVTTIRETLEPLVKSNHCYSIDLEVRVTKSGDVKVKVKATPSDP